VGQASRDLVPDCATAATTFRDRFRHREGVPTEDVEVFVDQRRQPRRILVPNRITFFAQFEREMMLERQAEVRRLAATGMAKARIALELKIGETTVYRILARDREQAHPASSA
jgi:DNA-binding NarL/FixJ family response regulator